MTATPALGVTEPARGWLPAPDTRLTAVNVPNAVTLLRTTLAIALAVAAIAHHDTGLLVSAYLAYWLGDVLDGASARLLGQETRTGAVFDIIADRACASLCVGALLTLRPGMALPIGVFFAQFMVLDGLLSLSFLRWPLLSPNYFGLVDRRVHRWNWSPPAKVLNTTALAVLVLVAPSPLVPTVLALAVAAVKVVSLAAVVRLAAR